MFTDRTQNAGVPRKALFTLALSLTLFGIISSAGAQNSGAGRLSSNPNDLRDAFAKQKSSVQTPKAFANYVAQNPALGQKYARHFGVPEQKVVAFFEKALVPHTLTQSRTLSTFGVTDTGTIYPVKTTLPAGTKVWATREGVPVLKWNCSNPLTSLLPGSTLNSSPLEYVSIPSSVLPSGSPVLDVPTTFTASSAELPFGSDAPALALAPPLPPFDFAFGVPATDIVGSAALPGIGDIIDAGGSTISDFWPALFIPIIFAATQGGEGEIFTGETPPLLLPPGENPGNPDIVIPPAGPIIVPEVNTGILLVGGLPILGIAFGIAKRRKK
ncbi:hypothetical protein LC612_43220 [Nostoc sp. CHAB 5834]|nr:hypothetical protein [Nostoc sp. CHAB 5834]